jgi:hypothetical protein
MGYLNRMGFFDHLSKQVDVIPAWPNYSTAQIHRGGNTALVEIARINKDERDNDLPTRLTNALMVSCQDREDSSALEGAAWTIFAELIDNIFAHSATQLDGYAALQVYSAGNRLSVAVSDSGVGIMDTLRPSLRTEFARLAELSDMDLLVEIFRQGISRHGTDRGCGLKGCAGKAIKFNAGRERGGGRATLGGQWPLRALGDDFRTVREALFGSLERRMLGHDFRRSGAVEAITGEATPAALSHAMGNTLSASNQLFATYVPVTVATINQVAEARRKGSRALR